MDIQIYKTTGCGYCVKIIELMNRAGVEYTDYVVGRDLTLEEFKQQYPLAKGFPFVIIDNQVIGGLIETVKYFVEKKLVSSRKK
jgi:glutaredoxin